MSSDFYQFEKQVCIEKLEENGEALWPVLRVLYFFKWRNLQSQSAQQLGAENPTSRLFRLKRLHSHWWAWLTPKDYFVFSDSLEIRSIEGKSQNKLFYFLFQRLRSVLYVEKDLGNIDPNQMRGLPRPVPSTLVDLVAFGLAFFIRPFLRLSQETQAELLRLEIIFGFPLAAKRSLCLLWAYRLCYRGLLALHRPKKVFISDAYNLSHFALIRECHRKNILSVEFQHGVINFEHPAYVFGGVDDKNKQLLRKSKYYAHELWVFGPKVGAELKDQSPWTAGQIRSLGHPYLAYLKQRQVLLQDFGPQPPAVIYVTLQWTDEVQVIDFMRRIAAKIPHWQIKLLPRKWSEAQSAAFREERNMTLEKKWDFYKGIQIYPVHVTTYSTTALEAPYFGAYNILLNFNDMAKKYFYQSLKDNRWTQFVENEEEFLQALRKIEEFRKSPQAWSDEIFEKEDYEKLLDLELRS